MAKILRSYRLDPDVVEAIGSEAKRRKITQTDYLVGLVRADNGVETAEPEEAPDPDAAIKARASALCASGAAKSWPHAMRLALAERNRDE